MQLEFNSSSVVVGYIKELLKRTRIPTYKKYDPNAYMHIDRLYLNGSHVMRATSSSTAVYQSDYDEENASNTLSSNSCIYDTHTHEYLGDYLRYLRDYKGVNLMKLYNCFSEAIWLGRSDYQYTYYAIPAKFGETYTIAMNCLKPIEIFVAANTGTEKKLARTVRGITRNAPVLYNIPYNVDTLSWRREPNLRLVLRVPSDFKGSIAVLEGAYANCANVLANATTAIVDKDTNKDFASIASLICEDPSKSIPMAPRLLEFLLGMAVTPDDEIVNNVARVQDLAYNWHYSTTIVPTAFQGVRDHWDDKLTCRIYDVTNRKLKKYQLPRGVFIGNPVGSMYSSDRSFADVTKDLTYYFDKDIATYLGGK